MAGLKRWATIESPSRLVAAPEAQRRHEHPSPPLSLARRALWPGATVLLVALVAGVNVTRGPKASGALVRVAEVTRGPLSVEVLAPGSVQPTDRLELRYMEPEAEVARVVAEPGEEVEPGQPLVELALQPLEQGAQQAQAQHLEARYRLLRARSGRREAKLASLAVAIKRSEAEVQFREGRLRQSRELGEAGLLSRADQAQAEYEHSAAVAALEQAKLDLAAEEAERKPEELQSLEAEARFRALALERAEAALRNRTLRSPGKGVVLEVPVRRGGLLRQGDLVAAVADVSRFRVSALVDEGQAALLKPGQEVSIRGEFFGGDELHGVVEHVVPSVRKSERGTPSVEMMVAVSAPGWRPPVGLTVDVAVRIERTREVLHAPLESVVERDGRPVVFVYEQGRARLRAVKVGLRSDTALEIVEGLGAGERVLTAGHNFLLGGESVLLPGEGSAGSMQIDLFR